MEKFKSGYEAAKKKKTADERVKVFKGVALRFVEGAAKAAGAGVVSVLKAHLGGAQEWLTRRSFGRKLRCASFTPHSFNIILH